MIAIISDFGNSEYLGVMKGVIYSCNKNARIADLYNGVKPYQVREGAWILYRNYRHFPKKTVFLCVVDPGVGGKRKCVAVKTKNYFFVGPDNGLMFPAVNDDGIIASVELSQKGASKTFHGRDVFAKAAARLDKGVKIGKLGKRTALNAGLDFYLKGREGEIVRIDNFGNVATNLPSLNKKSYNVRSGKKNLIMYFYSTYEEAPLNKLVLIRGSSDTLEISVRNGDASKKWDLQIGDRIEIS